MRELLRIENLSAGYGEAVVLSNVSLNLAEGQALALLGRNGMGKTTLVNTIVGVTRYFGGTIALDGADITKLRPDQRAHIGIGWVPQERNIFKSLTVHENLTAVARPGPWTTDKVYALFPRLKERRGNLGNQLSGGEQQMLAVARALVLNPRVMLLDEPLEGLGADHRRGIAGGVAPRHPRRRHVGDPGRAEREKNPRRHRQRHHHRARLRGSQRGQRDIDRRPRRAGEASGRDRYRAAAPRPTRVTMELAVG